MQRTREGLRTLDDRLFLPYYYSMSHFESFSTKLMKLANYHLVVYLNEPEKIHSTFTYYMITKLCLTISENCFFCPNMCLLFSFNPNRLDG